MFGYAESVATRNTILSSIRDMAAEVHRNKPAITISINGQPEGAHQKFYTTSDRIEGEVSIVAPTDTRFDEICITFEGTARTWMERFGGSPGTPGRSTVSQTFLHLIQPVDETILPIPRIATKGKTYTFPFTFVIPESLLPSACEHLVENSSVRDAHLHLPQSFGDSSTFGEESKDDYAPDMTRITYAIRARVLRKRDSDNEARVLVDVARKVPVSPAFEDAPPAHILDKSKDFVLHREKDLRRGLLGRKLGHISVVAEQPQPLRTNPNSPCRASTTATMSLTFVSNGSLAPPPTLESLTAKLRTSTFFSTTRTAYIPTLSRSTPDPSVGNYTETTLLSSRCLGGVGWEKLPSDPAGGKAEYKANLVVPITTPKGKHLVPSFSSCFISRSYAIDLSVSVRTSNHTQSSLTLKVPLQVSQPMKDSLEYEGMNNTNTTDVEEFFTPRIISPVASAGEANMLPPLPVFDAGVPAATRSESSQLPPSMLVHPPNQMPPPGYSVFGRVISGVPTRIPEPVGISPGCG